MSVPLSQAMEDYLKAIYMIAQGERRVTTNGLARALSVAPASVTNMVKRLARLRLVRHTPYRGVELTDAGRKIALEVIRHHRLLELYLSRHLGVSLDRVHDEADRLEHVISEDLEERIAVALGEPDRDPHGDPIPARDGSVAVQRRHPLTAVGPGRGGTIARVNDRDERVLRELAEAVLLPGVRVEVISTGPRAMGIRAHGRSRRLSAALAAAIEVELDEPENA